jgi:multidrug resistance efflux pump
MSFDWGPTASKRLLVIADRDEKIRALEQQLADFKLSHATVDAQREKAEAALAEVKAELKWAEENQMRAKPLKRAAGRESGGPERLTPASTDPTAAKPAALGALFVPPLPPSAARTPLGPVEKEQLKQLIRSAETQECGT